jgi:NADP-dependent alcohol dehydrogenase
MFDFTCYNPVRILFGRGTIARLADLVPENARLLLVYGGGSIIDTAKFIAVAIPCAGEEPWDMVEKKAPVEEALPLGCVVTLAATGSEMNANSVISRASTGASP